MALSLQTLNALPSICANAAVAQDLINALNSQNPQAAGGGSGAAGGSASVTGAAGDGVGNGGNATITGGAGGSTSGNGGNVNIVPGAGGGTGVAGLFEVNGSAGLLAVCKNWSAPANSIVLVIAGRAMQVISATARVLVVGSDGGAVTATVYKVPTGTAPGSGTAIHTGTINLKGTANANQTLTLSATLANLQLAAGDALIVVFTGTTTAAVGAVSVTLNPI